VSKQNIYAFPVSLLFTAARTRLRKMKADEASKKAAAASDASKPVEKSPHAKKVCFFFTANSIGRQDYSIFNNFLNISSTFCSRMTLKSLKSLQKSTINSIGVSFPSLVVPPSNPMISMSCTATICKLPREIIPVKGLCGLKKVDWISRDVLVGMHGLMSKESLQKRRKWSLLKRIMSSL
jgi:hypothetical protein